MAECCTRLVDDAGLRQAMGAEGRRLAQAEFDELKMIEQIEALYQRLVETKRTKPAPRA
jgi:glycosyltransferase involved in cell wall biosynthesis